MPHAEAASIRLLICDVDGVLTDGGYYYGPGGVEIKRFNTKDGLGLKLAMRSGLRVAILSARKGEATERRMAELGIEHVVLGSSDKKRDLRRICNANHVTPEETAFIGDDLMDLAAMNSVGYAMAVADAAVELQEASAYVTQKPGGHGAVREAVEHLLREAGRWEQIVDQLR